MILVSLNLYVYGLMPLVDSWADKCAVACVELLPQSSVNFCDLAWMKLKSGLFAGLMCAGGLGYSDLA